ncbi:MAG: serine hydrolase [Planctomycetes bacterium]|nr:serine hydrolase [Planctomycetota bacterium]
MTRCYTSIAIALLLVLVLGPPARAAAPDVQNIIDQRVRSGMAAGLVVGIVRDGTRQFYSAGMLRADGTDRVDENTIFEIGSISKVFTTLLLAQMDEQGDVKLSDAAQKFLPATVQMPEKDGKQITLEHLATHTSGLPRMPSNFTPADPQNPYADYTVQQMYDFLTSYTLVQEIGGQGAYSNLGMGFLGHLLELRSGKSYEELIITRICKPLGMTSTTTKPRARDGARVATGHQGLTPVSAWDIPTLAGAGDINSTAGDMLIFTAANLGLLKTPLTSTMRRCHRARVDSASPQMKIGLGWHISKKHDSEITWHNGGTGGFASFIGFRSDTNEGVVVLSNSAYRAVDQIGMHLLNNKYELADIPDEVAVDAAKLQDYAGTYTLPMGQILTVKVEADRLMVKLSGQSFYPVFPESNDKFFYKVVEAKLSFMRDKQGKVDRLILHQGGRDQAGKKMAEAYAPVAVEIDSTILQRYVGEYQFPHGGKMAVTRNGDQLKARLSGQPAIEIYAKSETRFFYKVVIAEISFQLDDQGKVQSLTLHQGGLDQVATRTD